MRSRFGICAAAAAALLLAACGDPTSPTVAPDGTACSSGGLCYTNIAYSCVIDTSGAGRWVRQQDCSQSTTPGCTCQVVSGFASCLASGGTCR